MAEPKQRGLEQPAAAAALAPATGASAGADLLPARRSVAHWVGVALPTLGLLALGYQRRWVSEDAFISLRVVEQILAGNGPVFNADERVEAYTHPLWVLLLTIWGLTGAPVEYGAITLGLTLAAVGLLAAQLGSWRLSQRLQPVNDGRILTLPVPLGALVFVSIPVVWDFATSGLETSLSFGWLGLCFWSLVRSCLGPNADRRTSYLAAVLAGLGPLVRPDLAIFSAGFLTTLALCTVRRPIWPVGVRTLFQLGLAAAALPASYQIFRMGYFAALVPNTALAKEASAAHWSQGWRYLQDVVDSYALWFPLLLVLAIALRLAWRGLAAHDWRAVLVLVAPLAGALGHALYIVRVGGDFMHGRLLLPALFGLILPVAMIALPYGRLRGPALTGIVLTCLVIGWAGLAASTLRVSYPREINEHGLADERSVYVDQAGRPHPVTLDDYMGMRLSWPRDGRSWRARAEQHARVLTIKQQEYPLSDVVAPSIELVAVAGNIGLAGFAAGERVHIVDLIGLSDPITSRLRLSERGRPGHEKRLPLEWVVARYAEPDLPTTSTPEVTATRRVLTCPALAELRRALEEPLSVRRFLENLRISWRLHRLRIAPDPLVAQRELCGSATDEAGRSQERARTMAGGSRGIT